MAWQALDTDLLRNDLLTSLFYLHTQPPLFNLFAGMIIKVFSDYAAQSVCLVFLGRGVIQITTLLLLFRSLANTARIKDSVFRPFPW